MFSGVNIWSRKNSRHMWSSSCTTVVCCLSTHHCNYWNLVSRRSSLGYSPNVNCNLFHFASPSWQVDRNGGIWEDVRIKKIRMSGLKKKHFILLKKKSRYCLEYFRGRSRGVRIWSHFGY